MIRKGGAAGLALLALGLAGCADAAPLPEPIRVGVIVSLTGGLGSVGPHLQQSALLVEREVNSAGGLLGRRPMEMVVEDDGTDPMQARAVAEQLVRDDGVVAIVGSLASSASLQAQEVTYGARIPQISCCSTSPDLTGAQPEGDRYLFRTVPSDLLQAVVIARHASETLMCARLGILHLSDAYGNPFGEAIESNFRNMGGSVVVNVGFPDGRPSYTTEVQMVAAANPDCIALVAFTESGGNILRDWNALPMPPDVTWIGTDGIRDPGFVEAAGRPDIVDGVTGTAPITAPETEQYNDYSANFEAVFSTGAGIFGGNQYDAAALLALAIERAGSTDGTAIRDALLQVSTPAPDGTDRYFGPTELPDALVRLREGADIDYFGASGPVDLDSSGNVVTDYEIWRYDAATMSFVRQSTIYASELTGM